MKRFLFGSLLASLAFFTSCSTTDDEDNSPDVASLITGTYQYTLIYNGAENGSGMAIIKKENNSRITIATDESLSFYANKLLKIDNDLVMEVPEQDFDYYGLPATIVGNGQVSLAAASYDGVYFGADGSMRISVDLTAEGSTDKVILQLK